MSKVAFLKVTHQDWVKNVQGLTGAEIKVLYYLKTLNPFGDREFEVSVTAIAKELGLSKGTVSKALKHLNQLGKIDLEIVTAKIKIHAFPEGNTVSSTKHSFQEETPVSRRKPQFPIGNPSFQEETPVSYRKQPDAETPIQQESCDSQTNKTNKTNKTLSEGEREKFLKFGLNKAAALPQPPTLPEKWVWKNFSELYPLFCAETSQALESARAKKTKKPKEETVPLSEEILKKLKAEVEKNEI